MNIITIDTLKQLRADKIPHILLDVRETDEWNEGHIEGAVFMPLATVPLKAEELLPDKDALIVTQCRSGGRSAQALEALEKLGYTNVNNLEGGILAWEESGFVISSEE